MKKLTTLFLFLLMCATTQAQIQVSEPEFIGSHYLLTSDSSYIVLPKEVGLLKEHKTKAGLFSKVASAVGNVGASVGLATAVLGNSIGALGTGLQVMTAAGSVSSIGSAVGILGHASGMDVVFEGPSSVVHIPNQEIRILIKAESNDLDPADLYRIVSFKSSKKERRMQWFETSSAVLGSPEAKKKGYIPFRASKYGNSSYLITIAATDLSQGEYGIFFLHHPNVQAATFSVK